MGAGGGPSDDSSGTAPGVPAVCAGLLSALLMNDTLAIIGTPLVLGITARSRISPKLLLLTLAVAITTGSLASPVGNPQNLLVAVNGGSPPRSSPSAPTCSSRP